MTRVTLAIVLACGWSASAPAAKLVRTPGSDTKFETRVTRKIGDATVDLTLTGVALREKFFLNVYAVASYIKEGVKVSTPEQLAAADVPKQLVLVMERSVSSRDMSAAVIKSIRANHSPNEFPEHLKAFKAFLARNAVNAGDRILLTHLPGVGFHCQIADRASITIKSLRFSRAIWDIYLGRKHLGDHIKQGLVSRL